MASPVAQSVDKATSEALLVPDWGANMELCDYASASFARADDVMKNVYRRLSARNPKVQVLSLTLLDACVKNGTTCVIQAASQPEIVAALATLCKSANSDVRVQACELVQTLGLAFASTPGVAWKPTYDRLVSEGVTFPAVDHSAVAAIQPKEAARVPAPAPAPISTGPSPYGGRAHNLHSQAASSGSVGSASSRGIPAAAPSPASSQAPSSGPPGIAVGGAGGGGSDASSAGAGSGGGGGGTVDPIAIVEAMSRSFEKVRGDVSQVKVAVASLARLLVEGTSATPLNNDLLDAVDFLQQCAPRLSELVEAGIAGIIQDERLFDDCLSTNEAVARVLHFASPIAAIAEAGDVAALTAFVAHAQPDVADLVDFDAAVVPSSSASGAGAVDTRSSPSSTEATGATPAATGTRGAQPPAAAGDDLLSLFGPQQLQGGGMKAAAPIDPFAPQPTSTPAAQPVPITLTSFPMPVPAPAPVNLLAGGLTVSSLYSASASASAPPPSSTGVQPPTTSASASASSAVAASDVSLASFAPTPVRPQAASTTPAAIAASTSTGGLARSRGGSAASPIITGAHAPGGSSPAIIPGSGASLPPPSPHLYNPFEDAPQAAKTTPASGITTGTSPAKSAESVTLSDFDAPQAAPAPVPAPAPTTAASTSTQAAASGGSKSVLAELDDILNS